MWLDPNQTTYCLPCIGPVLVSHWTRAASGRAWSSAAKAIPKGIVAGGCCWLRSHSRGKSFTWVDSEQCSSLSTVLSPSLSHHLCSYTWGENFLQIPLDFSSGGKHTGRWLLRWTTTCSPAPTAGLKVENY